jgi:hypothetical protein
MFMTLPSVDEERGCYEAFYDATSNEALLFLTCPICAQEKLARDGEQTMLLSDPSVIEILTAGSTGNEERVMILRDLVEVNEGGVNCWMCFDCVRALERRSLPKFALANNLWIGDVPSELRGLTIPEQLLIARHYPRCYIFKLFPRDVDTHISLDQLYSGMAGNASLFELNTQEVVEMLEGQRMPTPVQTLASVIAITFVSSRKLPKDWLKKTFRVRRHIVYDALVWLRSYNPIYADINIDSSRLDSLPEDDVPEELLTIVRQENDDEVVEREEESYLAVDVNDVDRGSRDNMLGPEEDGECFKKSLNYL